MVIDKKFITNKYGFLKNDVTGKITSFQFKEDSRLTIISQTGEVYERFWKYENSMFSFNNSNGKEISVFHQNVELSKKYRFEFIFFTGINKVNQNLTLIIVYNRLDLWLYTTRFLMTNEINKGIVEAKKHTYGSFIIGDRDQNDKIILGDYCQLGMNIRIIPRNHRTDLVSSFPFDELYFYFTPEKTKIPTHISKNNGLTILGNDIWIGDNVTILGGVTVGDGVIIGAGSVVSKDVPDYAIVAGNPAKVIRYRFTPEQIEKLKKISWWNWDDDKVAANMNKIASPNIDDFINEFYE